MACSAYNVTSSLNFTEKRFSKSFVVNPPSSVVFVRAPQPQKWNFLQCSSFISESNGFSGSKSSYTSGLKRSSQNSGFVRSASVEASGGLKRISENSIDPSDPSSKYRDLWVQCENEKCLGLNYKKDLMERLNICEHCGEHLKMSSSKRIELLIDPGTWEPMDEDMALDPIMFAFLSDSEEQLEGLFKMFEEGLEELTKLLEELFQEMSEERFELRELVLEGLDLEEEEALVGEAWSELAFSSLKKWWLELVLLALKEPEEEHLEEDLEKLGFVGSASDSAEGLVVLVIGGGGREHTLCSALQRSPSFDAVFCAPGNAGISNSGNATCISDLDISDSSAVMSFCQTRGVGLVVVGPEAPLVAGFANDLVKAGIPTFGPSSEATVLEGSKDFMKKLCDKYGIPTAKYQTFTDPSAAKQYIKEQGVPIVIKADGLAAGKGVVVAMTPEEAYEAVDSMLVKSAFGSAGCRVVIEEFLEGDEASFFFLVDGYDHCAYGFKE